MPTFCPNAVDNRELVMPGLVRDRRKILRAGFADHGAGGLNVGSGRGNVLIRNIELLFEFVQLEGR